MRIGKSGQGLGSLLFSDLPKSSPERKASAKVEKEVEQFAQERAAAPEQSHEDLRVALGAEPSETDEVEEVEVPHASDKKEVWVDFAVSQGLDREEAESFTKQDLVDEYGG